MELDLSIRMTAFQWLAEQTALHGDYVLPRTLLQTGFLYNGERVPLVGPQGIFKPKLMELPLSITTAPKGPYDDTYETGESLLYRYRGEDPQHRDNISLRKAMEQSRPLVHFFGLVPRQYLAVWPVYIVGDNPSALTFQVVVERDESGCLGARANPPYDTRGCSTLVHHSPSQSSSSSTVLSRACAQSLSFPVFTLPTTPSRTSGCRSHPSRSHARESTCCPKWPCIV